MPAMPHMGRVLLSPIPARIIHRRERRESREPNCEVLSQRLRYRMKSESTGDSPRHPERFSTLASLCFLCALCVLCVLCGEKSGANVHGLQHFIITQPAFSVFSSVPSVRRRTTFAG